jgi:hypothetical protein
MHNTAATHTTPPAIITHSVARIQGPQHAEISVHHARTPDARVAMSFSGILLVFYSSQAVQGLLEAFAAARGHMVQVPREIPGRRNDLQEPAARVILAIEWTRRPDYAVVAQSALNKLKTARIHWLSVVRSRVKATSIFGCGSTRRMIIRPFTAT